MVYMIKNIYIYVIIAVAVVGAVVFMTSKTSKQTEPSPSPSPTPSPTASVSLSPKPKPTGGINVEIYDELIVEYEMRRILLANDCQSADPSNIDFKNGTKIMLDNTYSSEDRIIKIGDNSYSIKSRSWIFTTLTSPTLPVNLPMFCGSMELGQLGIVK